jgi:hypothetical protein
LDDQSIRLPSLLPVHEAKKALKAKFWQEAFGGYLLPGVAAFKNFSLRKSSPCSHVFRVQSKTSAEASPWGLIPRSKHSALEFRPIKATRGAAGIATEGTVRTTLAVPALHRGWLRVAWSLTRLHEQPNFLQHWHYKATPHAIMPFRNNSERIVGPVNHRCCMGLTQDSVGQAQQLTQVALAVCIFLSSPSL